MLGGMQNLQILPDGRCFGRAIQQLIVGQRQGQGGLSGVVQELLLAEFFAGLHVVPMTEFAIGLLHVQQEVGQLAPQILILPITGLALVLHDGHQGQGRRAEIRELAPGDAHIVPILASTPALPHHVGQVADGGFGAVTELLDLLRRHPGAALELAVEQRQGVGRPGVTRQAVAPHIVVVGQRVVDVLELAEAETLSVGAQPPPRPQNVGVQLPATPFACGDAHGNARPALHELP